MAQLAKFYDPHRRSRVGSACVVWVCDLAAGDVIKGVDVGAPASLQRG